MGNGQKIDLLAEEWTRSGQGALVAIELKKSKERGTVEQLVGYIDSLKSDFPGRPVKGIITSGLEDQVSAAVLKGMAPTHDICWYCYHVAFEQVAGNPG